MLHRKFWLLDTFNTWKVWRKNGTRASLKQIERFHVCQERTFTVSAMMTFLFSVYIYGSRTYNHHSTILWLKRVFLHFPLQSLCIAPKVFIEALFYLHLVSLKQRLNWTCASNDHVFRYEVDWSKVWNDCALISLFWNKWLRSSCAPSRYAEHGVLSLEKRPGLVTSARLISGTFR